MSYGFWTGPASLVAIFLFALAWWLWSGEKVRAERVVPEDSHIEVWKSWYAEGKVSLEQFEAAVEEYLGGPDSSWVPIPDSMTLMEAHRRVQRLEEKMDASAKLPVRARKDYGRAWNTMIEQPNAPRYEDTSHLNREAQRELYLSLRSRGMVE